MNTMFSNQVVKECKGAALSVIVLLILNPGGVSQEFLERTSGYSDKPISQALAYLQETGRVIKTTKGWSLMAGVQLPLTFEEQECLPESEDNSDTNCQGRNNSDSALISSSNDSLINSKDLINTTNNKGRNNSDSDKTTPKNPAELKEIWEELGMASIRHNARIDELIQLPHITAKYIRAWRLQFVYENRGGYQWTGLFIKTLESGGPPPELNERGHLAGCTCQECQVSLDHWGMPK